jgi:hypothetical protein
MRIAAKTAPIVTLFSIAAAAALTVAQLSAVALLFGTEAAPRNATEIIDDASHASAQFTLPPVQVVASRTG